MRCPSVRIVGCHSQVDGGQCIVLACQRDIAGITGGDIVVNVI